MVVSSVRCSWSPEDLKGGISRMHHWDHALLWGSKQGLLSSISRRAVLSKQHRW